MILKLLFELLLGILQFAFSWVSLPAVPVIVEESVDLVLKYMCQGMGLVYLVVDKNLVLVLLPVVLALENFDKLYSVVMWILKKIPMLNIK